MVNISGKKICILGMQRSGFALAKLCHLLGAEVKVSETAAPEKMTDELRRWLSAYKISAEFNGHTRAFVGGNDILLLSPGVSVHSEIVQQAKAEGTLVLGEIEFAYQFISIPVITVTGSNGKTTVSTLIHEVLKKAGKASALKGNIGQPFSEYVYERIQNKNAASSDEYVVLEISSFQLESLYDQDGAGRKPPFVVKGFKPYIAVLLNFSQNHLDRHQDLEEYFQAKTKIFKNQTKDDFAVVNGADVRLRAMGNELAAQTVFFNNIDDFQKAERKNPNHLAVMEVARILNIPVSLCQEVFADFKGVEHRMEWIRQLHGVDYINDSKSTTAEASQWALQSLNQPILMICGGRDKNIDYSVLCSLVQQKVKKTFYIRRSEREDFKSFSGCC